MVVEEIETGVMNAAQVCRFYGIRVPVSIYKWLEINGFRFRRKIMASEMPASLIIC